jgi:hypothetical protein
LRVVSHLFLLMIMVSTEALLLPTCFSFPQEGDFAVYSVRTRAVCLADPNDEKVKEQIGYYENINNTVWNLTIQIVNYPNVTFSITKNLKNGTISENYEGNVETGTPDMDMWIISSNLSVADPIYQGESDPEIFIRERAPHEFANATRDVLYVHANQSQSGLESDFGFFWDRETGILCGASSTLKYYDENDLVLTVMINIQIVDTSLWMKTIQNDESNWLVIITLIVLISILIVTLMLFRKRKKKRK